MAGICRECEYSGSLALVLKYEFPRMEGTRDDDISASFRIQVSSWSVKHHISTLLYYSDIVRVLR